jgi:hypothetical protein
MRAEIKLFVLHIDLNELTMPPQGISKCLVENDAAKIAMCASDLRPKVHL